MNASFDGARRNLANAYNDLARKVNGDLVISSEDIIDDMHNLQACIGGLLCMYVPEDKDDCNDLSEDVKLIEVE